MKNFKNIALIITTLVAGVSLYLLLFGDTDTDLIDQERIKAQNERDEAIKTKDSFRDVNLLITDSLRQEEQNIKYESYTKLIYADRTLDDALDVLEGARYNSRTETED